MIGSGDICQVVGGQGQGKSPNLGLTVKVVSQQGEHSRLGRIVRCEGAGVRQLHDSGEYVVTGWADFAATWLRKAQPVECPHLAGELAIPAP